MTTRFHRVDEEFFVCLFVCFFVRFWWKVVVCGQKKTALPESTLTIEGHQDRRKKKRWKKKENDWIFWKKEKEKKKRGRSAPPLTVDVRRRPIDRRRRRAQYAAVAFKEKKNNEEKEEKRKKEPVPWMGRDFQRLSIASGQEIQSASFFFLLVFFFLPSFIDPHYQALARFLLCWWGFESLLMVLARFLMVLPSFTGFYLVLQTTATDLIQFLLCW